MTPQQNYIQPRRERAQLYIPGASSTSCKGHGQPGWQEEGGPSSTYLVLAVPIVKDRYSQDGRKEEDELYKRHDDAGQHAAGQATEVRYPGPLCGR